MRVFIIFISYETGNAQLFVFGNVPAFYRLVTGNINQFAREDSSPRWKTRCMRELIYLDLGAFSRSTTELNQEMVR